MDLDTYNSQLLAKISEGTKGYRYLLVYALDTTLYHSKPFNDEIIVALILDIGGRPVIWGNAIKQQDFSRASQLYIPTNDEDGMDAIRLGRRCMSLLTYMGHGVPILSSMNALAPLPVGVLSGQPFEKTSANGYELDLLMQAVDFNEIEDKTWIGLAYYRLGANSDSEYYKFLSWWQIIELFNDNDPSKVKVWVNRHANAHDELKDWRTKLNNHSTDLYGRLVNSREKCAHVANTHKPQRAIWADPDDPVSVEQVSNDLVAVELLAKQLLHSRPGIERL